MYLLARPAVRSTPQKPQSPPFVFPPVTSDDAKSKINGRQHSNDCMRDGEWSDTQNSRTPTRVHRPQSTERATHLSESPSQRSTIRSRSHSLSTADSQARAQKPQAGEFKIVIDHPNPVTKPLDKVLLPTLEVPIPHYRLGTPRFSARGTAFLHSSVYTRNSTNEDARSSAMSGPEYERLFQGVTYVDSRSAISRRHSHASPQPFSVRIAPMNEVNNNAAMTSSPAFHRSKDPIAPAIYDAMATNPDDPAIVRYAPNTREITAASPARIIAQITSKNFLDYELLSDFFLTVRAYLPIHDLLAYLLARFEWAINRFDDDGRVIRVRAFAALRHWVLNYFPYDFVIDRDLRVKFCERLNALSRTVRERSVHGPSDLKLILDLKKCWNGRCALYWDNQSFDNEGRPDSDINPGGIAGSRDSQLTHPSQLWTRTVDPVPLQIDSAVDPKESATALDNWFDAVIEAEDNKTKKHERQVSVVTSRSLPTSPTSEQSIPVMSCTLPGRGFMKLIGQAGRNTAHPIPVNMRKACPAAPSASANDRPLHQPHGHKRSGSFSDAFRDKRSSLPSIGVQPPEEPVMMAFPYSGSLIRGSVVPPGSPYFIAFTPNASVSDLRSVSSRDDDSDAPESSKYSSPLSPGVRNLFGTIRRALSSKQGSGHQSSINAGSTATPSFKASNLHSNVSQQLDPQGERRNLESLQKHSRVDLLCADVAEVYQRVIMQPLEEVRPPSKIGLALRNEQQQWIPEPRHIERATSEARITPVRYSSELTNGSRSILVFDDTANYPPVPTLPSRNSILAAEERVREPKDASKTLTGSASDHHLMGSEGRGISSIKPIETDKEKSKALLDLDPKPIPNNIHRDALAREDSNSAMGISRVISSHRPAPSSLSRGRSYRSTYSGSGSLRKYASFQSGIGRNAGEFHMDTATSSDSFLRSSMEKSEKPPGRMLRRRPGGDLRANQNVHDLEQIPRPRSTGSITTYTDSMRGSGLYMNKNVNLTQTNHSSQTPLVSPMDSMIPLSKKSLSLVRTHSSQPALRPSFEAAVAQFARIPDDDGGDIEATLLKLEGKYRKSPPIESPAAEVYDQTDIKETSGAQQRSATEVGLNEQQTNEELPAEEPKIVPHIDEHQGEATTPTGHRPQSHRYNMASSLYAESEESYNSTPLLERGDSEESRMRNKSTSNDSKVSMPRPLFSRNQSEVNDENLLSPLTETGIDTDSQRRIKYRSSIPTTTDSFLLDEDEFLSDLSSEISVELTNHETNDNVFGSSAQLLQPGATPSHSGNVAGSSKHPPTPPMSNENAVAIKSHANRMQDQRKPPTPDPSPVNKYAEPAKGSVNETPKPANSQPTLTPLTKFSMYRHLPFIMSYESVTVAEQLTIIEKDALNEINWQDLINMRWHHTSPSTLNWVDYLRTQDPTGIELVTARFNIVVKWVLSEVVLTQNFEERASVITKFIHVAKYCRKAHNYATLLQLTIALTSIDCSRLTKTWDLVPSAEKKALKDLETLVTPIKNFHNLRQEMETANADEGCIPVVGKSEPPLHASIIQILILVPALYIHDLTYNSQKPSQIASTRDGEPLINFERYRTTATIVKSLLRLIDASAKYTFQPVEGLIERCLWMASLSDDMIRLKSKELE